MLFTIGIYSQTPQPKKKQILTLCVIKYDVSFSTKFQQNAEKVNNNDKTTKTLKKVYNFFLLNSYKMIKNVKKKKPKRKLSCSNYYRIQSDTFIALTLRMTI